MLDPMSLIMGGTQLLGGVFSSLVGGKQVRQGNRLLKQSPHLDYEIPSEAIQAASEGLPSEQYANAMKNIQRQQATALSAANDRRGGLATIAKTQALSNDATGNLDAQDAAARMQNQRILGSYRDKAWGIKDRNRQEDRAYAYGLIGSGNQNKAAGFDKITSGVGYGLLGGFGGGKSQNQYI